MTQVMLSKPDVCVLYVQTCATIRDSVPGGRERWSSGGEGGSGQHASSSPPPLSSLALCS